MKIAGYKFDHIADITPLRGTDGLIIQHMPQQRYVNARKLPLNRYGAGPFCKFTIPNHHRASGVYILSLDDEIRYIGETANLAARYNAGYGNISPKNCFKGGQETNCRLNNLIYSAAAADKRISLWFHPTDDYKEMEAAMRAVLKAEWNRV